MQDSASKSNLNINKIVLSSVLSLFNLATSYPKIMEIPSFIPLFSGYERFKARGRGCNCSTSRIIHDYNQLFESAITKLTEIEKTMLKDILKCDKICYYKKNPMNVLTMECF